jgi:hypothetical protein
MQDKTNLFVFYAEAQRILAFSKDTASRGHRKTNSFVFIQYRWLADMILSTYMNGLTIKIALNLCK